MELICLVKIQLTTENLLQKFKYELECGSVIEYVFRMYEFSTQHHTQQKVQCFFCSNLCICQALVSHACDLNTQETEQQECCEFEASLRYGVHLHYVLLLEKDVREEWAAAGW